MSTQRAEYLIEKWGTQDEFRRLYETNTDKKELQVLRLDDIFLLQQTAPLTIADINCRLQRDYIIDSEVMNNYIQYILGRCLTTLDTDVFVGSIKPSSLPQRTAHLRQVSTLRGEVNEYRELMCQADEDVLKAAYLAKKKMISIAREYPSQCDQHVEIPTADLDTGLEIDLGVLIDNLDVHSILLANHTQCERRLKRDKLGLFPEFLVLLNHMEDDTYHRLWKQRFSFSNRSKVLLKVLPFDLMDFYANNNRNHGWLFEYGRVVYGDSLILPKQPESSSILIQFMEAGRNLLKIRDALSNDTLLKQLMYSRRRWRRYSRFLLYIQQALAQVEQDRVIGMNEIVKTEKLRWVNDYDGVNSPIERSDFIDALFKLNHAASDRISLHRKVMLAQP